MNGAWTLPTRLTVGGKLVGIHSDFRDILDILRRLSDESEPLFIRWRVALALFYEEEPASEDLPEAMQKLSDFIACGQKPSPNALPHLLDWEQDAPLIAADVNKVAGCEVRALPYLHWWTFLSYFHAIGEGQLSTLLRVRSKLRRGKKLEAWEQDYYRQHRELVECRPPLSPAEQAEKIRLEKLLAGG